MTNKIALYIIPVIFASAILSSVILSAQTNEPKPLLRDKYFVNQREYSGNEEIQNISFRQAIENLNTYNRFKKKTNNWILSQEHQWRNIGPEKIGGRVKSIAIHPQKPEIAYIGAAAGGIWKTSNFGSSWTPIFDFENSIAFGALAIDTKNPEILYAGTGEAVIGGGNIYFGSGICKSINAGDDWSLIGLTDVSAFSKIYIHPVNSNLLVAGAVGKNAGFYVSSDAGITWENMFSKNITDIAINPYDSNQYFVGVSGEGIYYTADRGNSWNISNRGIEQGLIGRVSIVRSPSHTDVLYALMERGPSKDGVIYKSLDAGDTWQELFNGGVEFFRYQGFYNNFIQIHPTNPNIVLAGGIDLWRTQNGGKTWQNVRNNVAGISMIHVDQHVAEFAPSNPDLVYLGNDGGVYLSRNAGAGWSIINNNLQITQFYALAVDNFSVNRNFGGTQDNGTLGNPANDRWKMLAGGDGMDVIVDRNNPNIIYGEYQYGGLWKVRLSESGEVLEFVHLTSGIPTNDNAIWHAPFLQHPTIDGLFFHGRGALYFSTNSGDFWQELMPKRLSRFTSIALSTLEPDLIYAGNEIGEMWVTKNFGKEWTQININGLPGRYITDIKTSYFNSATVYVTFSGFGSSHVFKSTDYGSSWLDIGFDLPDVPVNAIAMHPDDEKMLFIGTDVGVFSSFNSGLNWYLYGLDLPRSPVIDLAFHKNRILQPELLLRAATHGRSMWEITVPDSPDIIPVITKPIGGEVWLSKNRYNISWYGIVPPVKVEFRTSNTAYEEIATDVTSNSISWMTPEIEDIYCQIRVTSLSAPLSYAVSNTFTLRKRNEGDITHTSKVNYVPYGIVDVPNSGLWTTDYTSDSLVKLDKSRLFIEKKVKLPYSNFITDIAYNEENSLFYIHKLNDENGVGGIIFTVDTLGNFINTFDSPAKNYPIGLTYYNGYLYASERDAPRKIYRIAPDGSGSETLYDNPYQVNFGPRSLANDGVSFHQVSTGFPNQMLTESQITVFDIYTSAVTNEVELSNATGLINARGIDIDKEDGDYWITDYNGNIYKIASQKTTVSINQEANNNISIFPNPANSFFIVSSIEDYNEIKVYDVQGNCVISHSNNEKFDEELKINTTILNTGIYFVVIKSAVGIVTAEKLIVIKN